MRMSTGLRGLLGLLLLIATPLGAATFEVSLSGLSFSPAQLTIQVGDTVRWRNRGGFHDVVADDGSFRSGNPTAAEFVYELTFNTPGTFGYFCSVHGSPGSGMAGTIIVQGGGPPPPTLSRAHNGSWLNPQTDGQGFLFEVAEDPRVFTFAWFTWGEDGAYDWVTGAGEYQGDSATLVLTRTRGGRFDDPTPVEFSDAGTATFRLTSCSTGVFEFSQSDPPRSGSIALSKLLPAGPECVPATAAPGSP